MNEGLCFKYRVNSRWANIPIQKDAPVPKLNTEIRIQPRDRVGNSLVCIKEGRVVSETTTLLVVTLSKSKVNECFLKSDFQKGILKFEYINS